MPETLGRYELLHRIAAGGMGEVFLARQQGPVGFEKFLVIKTLLPHLTEDQDFVNMFFDEARIAAMLSHPNIAQIYDLGDADGRYYIAMEYVQGETLRETISASEGPGKPPLTLGLKCRIIAGAAHALEYAHEARNPAGQHLGLIHRDVSPHNIMIAFAGNVKLVDFGIAKANNKLARTATGVIKGKYAYMSPEQAYGKVLDRRSDVFALGIVFHELLTQARLFRRDTEQETMRAVAEADVPRPSDVVKGVPKALDAIVMKALERERDARYQSCAQLQADLEAFLQRQRLPATSAHLAAYMTALFPEASAPDALARLSQIEVTEEKTPEANDTFLSPVPSFAYQREGSGSLDPAQLEARLAGCAPTDQIHGVYFTAAEAAVSKAAGPRARAAVRKAAEAPRDWVDALKYPTRDFLRVLWRAVEQLTPKCGGIDAAFSAIGDELLGRVLDSPLGAPLQGLPPQPSPKVLAKPLVQLVMALVQPGARMVTSATDGAAEIVFKGEVLPMQLHAALFHAAFRRFQGPMPRISWEKTLPERVELRLRW